MNNCGTCKWWKKSIKSNYKDKHTCYNPKIFIANKENPNGFDSDLETYEDREATALAVATDASGLADFVTNEMFGCNLHEADNSDKK
jgi:hypothetical protein